MRTIPLSVNGGVTAKALQARLWNEHQIEILAYDYGDRRFVRLSIQAYNSPSDVDRLVSALAAML